MFPELETDRLLLREIEEKDVKAIYRILSRPDVTVHYGQEPFTTIEEARSLLAIFNMNYSMQKGIRWGMVEKDSGAFIGTIGYHAWHQKHKRAEIGYELHPDFWKKGYGMEAISEVISYGFSALQLNRISAIVYPENNSSQKMLERAGFHKEGTLAKYMVQNEHIYDCLMYCLLHPSLNEKK
ncbi:GNAT family protein [Niallia taxi]|uniref:GNAT family N-acetyltransferase n=1 Tax=Niallia taxi TaxID=2499688 RepID=UPI00398245A1